MLIAIYCFGLGLAILNHLHPLLFKLVKGPKLIRNVLVYPFDACFISTHGWLVGALFQFYNFSSLSVFVVL
jgi:hypothetical protein